MSNRLLHLHIDTEVDDSFDEEKGKMLVDVITGILNLVPEILNWNAELSVIDPDAAEGESEESQSSEDNEVKEDN